MRNTLYLPNIMGHGKIADLPDRVTQNIAELSENVDSSPEHAHECPQ